MKKAVIISLVDDMTDWHNIMIDLASYEVFSDITTVDDMLYFLETLNQIERFDQ